MADAPELPLRCVEARLFCAWVSNRPIPAFANNTNALYAAAWWARYTARDEAIAKAVALSKARGATESTMLRADHVAWRIADPAGFQEFGPPMKKRQKAEEKAALEALRAATALVAIVFKKARRAARATAKVWLADTPKAAQLAARAQACADEAGATFNEVACAFAFYHHVPRRITFSHHPMLDDLHRQVSAVQAEAYDAQVRSVLRRPTFSR